MTEPQIQYNDYPIEECVATADKYIAKGMFAYQKFTCDHCGSRQTMGEPNTFFTSGTCEACGKTTDLKKKGCNYLLSTTPL